MKSLGGNVVIGTEVELHSLARDDLNGRRGVIVSFDTACRPCLQRAGVKLEGTETPVAIRPQNLREVTAAGAVVSPQSAELSTEPRPPIAADVMDELRRDLSTDLSIEARPPTAVDAVDEPRRAPSIAPSVFESTLEALVALGARDVPKLKALLLSAVELQTRAIDAKAVGELSPRLAAGLVAAARPHFADREALFCTLTVLCNNIAAGFLARGVQGALAARDTAVAVGLVEEATATLQMHSSSQTTDLELCISAVYALRAVVAPATLECSAGSEPAKDRAASAADAVCGVLYDCLATTNPMCSAFFIEACLFFEGLCIGPGHEARRERLLPDAQALVDEGMRRHFGGTDDGSGMGVQQAALVALRAMRPPPGAEPVHLLLRSYRDLAESEQVRQFQANEQAAAEAYWSEGGHGRRTFGFTAGQALAFRPGRRNGLTTSQEPWMSFEGEGEGSAPRAASI